MKVDNEIKKALLEAMDEFHRVCEKHNLKYYLIGGSLIGAIRHKGCIPWDDDIDIVMFKDDFERLLQLRMDLSANFELIHRSFPDSLLLPIARIENHRVMIDEGYFSGNETGVFIDVFCFETTFNNKVFQKIHFMTVAFFRLIMRLKKGTFSKNKYNDNQLKFFSILGNFARFIPNKFLNILMSLAENLGSLSLSKKYVANLHGVWKLQEIAPKQIFEKRKLYDFEGRQYWSLEDADSWLRPIYGDYMQLPSEEHRKPKHIDKIVSINGVSVVDEK